MSEPFTRAERDAVVARIAEVAARLFPKDGTHEPIAIEARTRDTYLHLLGEYADRLPRVVMSACPFTGAPLKRAFDPFGTDGPWWHKDRTFTPDEPAAPPAFRTLLGALDLRGRVPAESTDAVLAGPDAPFVVPALLRLPGMVAVVSRLELATGDLAYPVAYFSRERIHPAALHQHWTRPELWFTDDEGTRAWTVSNHAWDFDLAPWIERGQLRWIRPGDARAGVVGPESGERCPYLDLSGDRMPQVLGGGERTLDEPPDGEPPDPFSD